MNEWLIDAHKFEIWNLIYPTLLGTSECASAVLPARARVCPDETFDSNVNSPVHRLNHQQHVISNK